MATDSPPHSTPETKAADLVDIPIPAPMDPRAVRMHEVIHVARANGSIITLVLIGLSKAGKSSLANSLKYVAGGYDLPGTLAGIPSTL